MKFTGKLKGKFGSQNMYEVEVDQENGTVLAYTVSESDLVWLNSGGKSKWEVKCVASSVREAGGESPCSYYEVDLAAQKEAVEMDALYFGGMSDSEREAMEAWAAQTPEGDPGPFDKCGPFCKHSKRGKGYPGETVYHCVAPGNEHIIHVDFNISEII